MRAYGLAVSMAPSSAGVGSARSRAVATSAVAHSRPFFAATSGHGMSTIFAKIIAGESPADIVFRDERVTCFRDIAPQAPTHILIVPNEPIPTVNDLTPQHADLMGHMVLVARQLAAEEGIAERGYRLVVNVNPEGGQVVYHLHMHLIGGRPLGSMTRRVG